MPRIENEKGGGAALMIKVDVFRFGPFKNHELMRQPDGISRYSINIIIFPIK